MSDLPLYDWKCGACGFKFEAARSIAERDIPLTCPECGGSCKRIFINAPTLPWTPSAAESGRRHYTERLREGC